ncbi:MAG TPA: glycosyltransferase family 4 protein [Gemmatimonadales bacterium]|nr:glycosyltransferase family 4 protein [Gemmatimonadales bacterium]
MRAVVVSHAYLEPARRGRLRALVGLGCQITAAVPDRWQVMPGILHRAQWEDDGGVQVVPVAVGGEIEDPAEVRWSRRALRRLLKEFRPDVIQIEEEPWTRAAARAAADARKLRIPFVAHTRHAPVLPLGARLRRRSVLAASRGILAENPLVEAEVARDFPAVPHAVVPQVGVTLPLSSARPGGDPFTLGCVGRIVPALGLDVLLRACVRLARPWRLLISGTGPSQIELEALADRLGIAARITWLGAQPAEDRDRIWPALDCLVTPSRTSPERVETLGLSALHAMAHGVPVIATNVGALPGTIGEAGIVVPEDDIDALAEAIERLAADPARRTAAATAGRRRAMEEFSNDVLARRTLEFWRTAAGSVPASPAAAAV